MKAILQNKPNKDEISVITGNLDIHVSVDKFMEGQPLKYLTIEEMCILYPYLVPLTHRSG